jgi:hypothetical protein
MRLLVIASVHPAKPIAATLTTSCKESICRVPLTKEPSNERAIL